MAVLDLGKVVPEKGTDYFTEQDIEEIVSEVKSEITVPTKTSDLTNDSGFIDNTVNNLVNYELKTNTGATIELSINSSTYVMTMVLKNSSGTALSTQTVDLPLESVVVSGSYDNTNKKIVLTLQNGSTIDVPVGDLVSGLQAEITNNNKLSSDLVDDTNHTNLFVTASEKTTWNNKSDFSGSYNDLTNKPDLSVYATNSITGALADLDTTDKTNLVNAINEVASSSGGGGDYPKVFYLYNDNKYEVPVSGTDTNATRMAQVSQFITDAINNNIRPQLIFVCNNTYVENLSDFGEREVCSYTMKTNPTQKTSYVFRSDEQWLHKYTLGKASTFSTYGSGKYYQRYTLTIYGSWSDNVFTATSIGFGYENCNLNQMLATVSTVLARDNEDAYTPTTDYHPATKKYVDDATKVNVITSSTSTYTIDSLVGNTSYKLGEITALTISATTTFDKESVIYFESGTTATTVSLPSTITNLGDVPTMTETSGVNSGTCTASKNYIIAIQNNIAVWKEY